MKKILIIQTAFIGDVILATPLIEQLAAHHPMAQIDFLLRKGNQGLLQGHPLLHRVIIWDKQSNKNTHLLRILGQLRAERYDLVVNAQRYMSTGLLTAFSGAGITVGFEGNPLSRLFSHRVPHRIGDGTHEVERNLALLEPLLGFKPALQRPRLYPSEQDVTSMARPRPYVTIAPNSVWFTKQWPWQKWTELIDALPQELDVILLGGPSDRPSCQQLAASCKRRDVQVMAGECSFLQSAALMQAARMNYVNDSAPLHMASAMNAPVCAVFLSTAPVLGFVPLSDRAYIFEHAEPLPCRPCGLHGHRSCPQGHFRCADIPVAPLAALAEV